ncbi:MAG: hypothetical protein IJV86_01125 [Clostridia bacterium]|nr:hypothetical protein [Clostridia bacterium]
MEHFYDAEGKTYALSMIIVIVGFFIIFAFYVNVVMPFMEERKYIKKEIKRSDGEEYYYWKRELKRLYLTHMPIIGRFFR